MYKHIVEYRHKTKEGNISPMKTLEFELDKQLYYDGPGEWKVICANMITSKTGINTSWIYVDDGTMKMRCLGKVQNNDTTSSSKREMSQEERESHYASTVAANRERREAKEAELERKAIRDERQRLIDIEEAKVRAEKEARERAERKQRANELRSQGKNFQAFLVEFQNGVIGVSVVLGLALFFFFFIQNKESNKADAMKINSELELIEDSVKIYINNKNYDKALLLANKLVHSSHEDMEHLEFDAWSGYPKFDEYWTKKREEYKKIIFNKGSLNSEQNNTEKTKVEKKEQQEEESPIENNEPIHNENEGIDNQDGLDDEYKN